MMHNNVCSWHDYWAFRLKLYSSQYSWTFVSHWKCQTHSHQNSANYTVVNTDEQLYHTGNVRHTVTRTAPTGTRAIHPSYTNNGSAELRVQTEIRNTHSPSSGCERGNGQQNVHKFPDPWHWMKNCLEQRLARVFRVFYERYIRENSPARMR